MAFNDLNSISYSVVPNLRKEAVILADLEVGVRPDSTTVAKAKLAQVELHMHNGETFYKRRRFPNALEEFKTARALVYQLLYPGFDVGSFVLNRKDLVLPASSAVEKALLESSVRMTDAVRPQLLAFDAPLQLAANDMPPALKPYMSTGFRESVGIEETLQKVNAQAISLLNDGKPDAAVNLLQSGLAQITPNVRVDPTLAAATQLNLAAAQLQRDDPRSATKSAEAAASLYAQVKDNVGQAQALHLSGVSAQRLGETDRAKQLLTQAAETLKGAPTGAAPTGAAPTAGAVGAVPRPTGGVATLERPVRVPIESPPIGPTRPSISVSSELASRNRAELQPITDLDTSKVTYRIPGRAEGWGQIALLDAGVRTQQAKPWNIGVPVGEAIAVLPVAAGKPPAVESIVSTIYQNRLTAKAFTQLDIKIVDTSTTTLYLTHLYAYVLPVKIGDCFQELGQYSKAEEYYLLASNYTYLNKEIEGTALWIRLARNAVEWGDSIYKAEDLPNAKIQYAKLITDDGKVPASFFYNSPTLSIPADQAKNLIANLLTRPLPAINWEIAIWVLTASSRLQQILSGLDYYGLLLSPIHTFEYLQGVARAFAQQAIQAEREFITFKSHQELEEATRRDLETAKAMAQAEAQGRWEQYMSAIEDEQAAQKGLQLATKRRDDAKAQRDAYAASSWAQIWGQAAASALSGGEDAYWSEISELADKLARGETIHGPGPKLAAAQLLYAGRKTRDYELKRMQDTIDELTQAIGVAQDQAQAATRRKNVAEIAWQAAVQRAQMADASLAAFDSELFTPESWGKIAGVMRDISRSYLFQAIRIAKLMERAYNFENDSELKIIKSEYGYNVGNASSGENTVMLGGDGLLKDVDSFTYHAITAKTRKNSRLKDVISVAANFPAQFEAFVRTGLLSIETDLYEFDRLHPGFYGQRLEAVEVQIIGLVPEEGLNGTLTAGGVTRYRKKDGTTGQRLHQVDTMALSDFVLRNDIFLYSTETGVRGLFQGLGAGSTWQLHLPKRSNDFDFRRIFDVQLVLYYTAKFDPLLRTSVLAKPPRPDEMALVRNYGLRYDFPDAWYAFYKDGAAQFNFDRVRLPMNQQNFKTKSASFRVATKPGVSNQGIDVRLTGPTGVQGTVKTDANGAVSTATPALAGLAGTSPVGMWKAEVIGGASLMDAGKLKLDRVYNLQFGLEYSFDYVPEEL